MPNFPALFNLGMKKHKKIFYFCFHITNGTWIQCVAASKQDTQREANDILHRPEFTWKICHLILLDSYLFGFH